jgi:predicted amidophosphoribosyltransferase
MLAAELSMLSHIPAEFTALKKIRHTTPQVHCNGKQRLKNIKDAFEVTALDKVKGKRILLIDDVYTTGATLRECARVLKKAGAKSVDAITVARVYKQ